MLSTLLTRLPPDSPARQSRILHFQQQHLLQSSPCCTSLNCCWRVRLIDYGKRPTLAYSALPVLATLNSADDKGPNNYQACVKVYHVRWLHPTRACTTSMPRVFSGSQPCTRNNPFTPTKRPTACQHAGVYLGHHLSLNSHGNTNSQQLMSHEKSGYVASTLSHSSGCTLARPCALPLSLLPLFSSCLLDSTQLCSSRVCLHVAVLSSSCNRFRLGAGQM